MVQPNQTTMTELDLTRPGYCDQTALDYEHPVMTGAFIDFMIDSFRMNNASVTLLDVGDAGYKSNAMSEYWDVVQLKSSDFNFSGGSVDDSGMSYQVVTCFETLEHIQNPLLFIKNISHWFDSDGVLFLSTPGRPKFLWGDKHFREYTPKELQKWLLNPLGLEIVRSKRVRIDHPWWFYFTGFRPFMRLFFGYTNIYEIKYKS